MNLKKVFNKKNILITGGLGFIGSSIAHRLVQYGGNITLLDSLIPEYGGNLANIAGIENKVTVNIGDIRDHNSMPHLVRNKDYIFNLAGQVSHIDSMENPYTDLDINCRSQLFILEACRHHNTDVKIVFAATRQQYGDPEYLPIDERHPLKPIDVNGINKAAGEWYHLLYGKTYNFHTTSLRLTNIYGPRQLMKHNRQGFVYWFMRQILDGKNITIFGDGAQLRDLLYVEDVVEAFLLAAATEKTNGEIYNIGGIEPVSLLEFTKVLIDTAEQGTYSLTPFPKEYEKIAIGNCYLDHGKFSSATNWQPQVGLTEGLKNTLDYYREHKTSYW